MELENPLEAIVSFDLAVKKARNLMDSPNNEEAKKGKDIYLLAQTNKGRVLLEQEEKSEAINTYREARKVDQKYFRAIIGLADALKKDEQYEEAIKIVNEIIEDENFSDDEKAIAWYYRGLTLRAWEKCEEANNAFDQALILKPDFTKAYEAKYKCSN
jgi:tetratricopeptide (TPR) repeat protein